jgi:hypothetical protein
MIIWSLITMAQFFLSGRLSFLVCRFLLGYISFVYVSSIYTDVLLGFLREGKYEIIRSVRQSYLFKVYSGFDSLLIMQVFIFTDSTLN